ncbi:nuclear transport factor 2 family protein [Celeribacter indicus]|uniref:SnoaL-like domain-containing protein n=1 Tax=Celeribacter indicus TaxID=1208324 RepID=A0A0B5E4E5_9RHOB|nr:nuclear transport factor 2 family protein [Celeribacter indicus]AJE47217.1 hypothetical protein P73_2502 [Celeribacter indicus]SDW00820.1 SnoaL-like polyketide cyclase [Celeribacter indicus]
MTGLELLTAWYERIWVKGDLSGLDEYFERDASAGGLMSDLATELEDFRALIPAVLLRLRDISFEVEDAMELGDRAWMRMTLRARRAEDMNPVSISGQVMIRTRHGKIVEAHNAFDLLSYFEQMGNLPRDTIALCLAGEELR